jgi:hypothetical protein
MANKPDWYRLDNSALIYPAVMRRDWAAVFRVSITLNDTIQPTVLQTALEDTMMRIPTFRLSLHRGLFWFYLDTNRHMPHVEPDVLNPCKKIDRDENDGYLFRIRYYRSRIALEVFHSITDGTGAMIFLKTLAARYLTLLGHPIEAGEGVLDCEQPPQPEEMEDSHTRYAQFRHIEKRREAKAYHPRMTRQPVHTLNIITGSMPLEQVREQAKALGVTINEYLAGALCYTFGRLQNQEGRKHKYPVKISVPVNMRTFYPSSTLRNFSLFINPGVDPNYGDFTFEETVQQIHHIMRMRLNEKYLNAVLSTNVGNQKNKFARFVPLFIKNPVMDIGYRLYGESRYTVVLSNLGVMKTPPSMTPFVERFDFIMGPPRTNTHGATAVSYQDRLYLTVSSVVEETEAERLLFTEFVKRGISVKIESNHF